MSALILRGSRNAAWLPAVMALISAGLLLHSVEPVFNVLVLAGLALATRAAQQPRLRLTLSLGLVVAAAILTRYAGVVLVPVVTLAVLVPPRSWRDRGRHLGVFILSSALPVAAWLVRNASVASTLTGNRDGRPVGLSERGRQILTTTTRWLVPPPLPERYVAVAIGLVLLAAAAAVPAWRSRRRPPWLVLAGFVATGLPVMAIISDAAASSTLRDRLLSPFAAPLILLVVLCVDSVLDLAPRRAAVTTYAAAGALLLVSVASTAQAVRQDPSRARHSAYARYNSTTWRQHPVIWVGPDRAHVPPSRLRGVGAQPIDVTPSGGVYKLSLANS